MKIEVGRLYEAVMVTNDSEFEGWVWNVQIIADLIRDGETYFVGVMSKGICNQTAQIFNSAGESPDRSENAMGFRLVRTSRAKAKWLASSTLRNYYAKRRHDNLT
jgi:hypothetical protein